MNDYYARLVGIRPLCPRDINEPHRAATPLEVFFDLVSVISIAAAAAGLHHIIADNHVVEGIVIFVTAFFPIWWAWMNFTWFASAYDNDDTLYRLLVLTIMSGAITMAAGIGIFFESLDMTLIVVGFVIMRLSMVVLWVRAARHDPGRFRTALWYAGGIVSVQVYWVTLLLNQPVDQLSFFSLFALGAMMELSIPVIAERHGNTPWHRHHIMERYGLLNIIVLGETLLAGSVALKSVASHGFNFTFLQVALSALVILFSMWWVYFSKEEHLQKKSLAMELSWGYGHLMIFMSGAAVGAGFAVLIDIETGHARVGGKTGIYSVAIPVALYLMGLWFVRDRFVLSGASKRVLPLFSFLIVMTAPLLQVEGVAALILLAVIVRNLLSEPKSVSLK
ncbi:low temperature requirement protein A [Halomonas heilongjiangensis]|uniref:Low temperature requirement protein A n=1 Tax=Halomonas heilongjiangensis TaxID=1387883 RepID=A0A2N7TFQ6_9GAMM|nr:low temperature requirement protein A [Halomonas heilongjiangensis]PMR66999.1 low temperature requirement protein A [Halomonas heilongjiangensis]PXX88085.1 low temperature requirement protein A [Halomonas heilongjiangensis]